MFAYVGSRTTEFRRARGKGLSVYSYQSSNGVMELVQVLNELVNPSYLTLSSDGSRLYCVHGDLDDVSAFRVNAATGCLSLINQQKTGGMNPVHLALDREQRHLVVTNHLGSSLAVFPIDSGGALLPRSQLVKVSGPLGPHRVEQQQAKPHFNVFSPDFRHVIVPDKGLDRVFSFHFDNGCLKPAEVPFVSTREGSGPRNAVFHPMQPWLYVVNELDSTVTAYRFDAETGALVPTQVLPSVPCDFAGNNRAAGVTISANGRLLYTSNRGHDSVSVFRIDQENGLLSFLCAVPTGGQTPRFITLAPDNRYLFALNEDSDTIVAFNVQPESGELLRSHHVAVCGSPVCMVFSEAVA